MLLSAALPPSAVAIVPPRVQREAIVPAFSWDTLPVAFHSSASGKPFSAPQIKELARYSMVTIEKFQDLAAVAPASTLTRPYSDPGGLFECQNGSDLGCCGCCAEDEIVAAARAIKAVNPHVVTIAYMNAQISYPWYRAARPLAANASWWLTDASHDGPASSTWKMYDLSVAEAAQSWVDAATNLTATGVIDGVFADGCLKKEGGPNMTPSRIKKVYDGKVAMLRRLQAVLPGPIVCGSSSSGGFMHGLNAVQAENWGIVHKGRTHYGSEEIPMLRAAVKAGVIFQAHGRWACGQTGQQPPCCDATGPPCNCTTTRPRYDDAAVQNEIAAFLVAAGHLSYYVCGSWEDTFSSPLTTSTWLPLYDLPLGAPLTDGVLKNGVWRRSFASGTNATFDTKTERGTVLWGTKEFLRPHRR